MENSIQSHIEYIQYDEGESGKVLAEHLQARAKRVQLGSTWGVFYTAPLNESKSEVYGMGDLKRRLKKGKFVYVPSTVRPLHGPNPILDDHIRLFSSLSPEEPPLNTMYIVVGTGHLVFRSSG